MTITVSPPKCLGNATSNTFVIAMGRKKSKGAWEKVESMFLDDMEELASSHNLFYHGGIQKIVPCYIKNFAWLSDKAERNGLTGTIGHGSNLHRCFGVAGVIQTPSCKLDKLSAFLTKEQDGRKKTVFGWSQQYISRPKDAIPNGAIFPSCGWCRKEGLTKMGLAIKENGKNPSACEGCADWDIIDARPSNLSLTFPSHRDYPTFQTEGSPVSAPKGRDAFHEEPHQLPFVRVTWGFMKAACCFAFYQASRPKKGWTKTATVCYLKHCGVSKSSLYGSSKLFVQNGHQFT
jgi:hypothetical protein